MAIAKAKCWKIFLGEKKQPQQQSTPSLNRSHHKSFRQELSEEVFWHSPPENTRPF